MSYMIIRYESIEVLESNVRFYVRAGWTPVGGVSCGVERGAHIWAQALTKADSPKD